MKNNVSFNQKTVFYKCIESEEFLIMSLLSGDITWQEISNSTLPYNFLVKNMDSVVWEIHSLHINNKSIIELCKDKINWKLFCTTLYFKKIVNYSFLKRYREYISWEQAILRIEFTDNIFNEFFEEIYTGGHLPKIFDYRISKNKISCICLDELSEYFDNETWKALSKNQLDGWFIEKYSDKLNWKELSKYQKFSEGFMKNNVKKIKWNHINISCLFRVSNDFLVKYVVPNITDEYKVSELYDYNILKLSMLKNTHLESAIDYIKNRNN